MEHRTCSRCGKTKPATRDFYKVDRAKPGELRAQCRECFAAQRRSTKDGKMPVGNKRTLMLLSDFHFPEHDRAVWATTLELAKAIVPGEVILMGDFLEMGSVSQHTGSSLEKLTEDFAAGKQALQELRAVVNPSCKITYLEGNHESRLSRFIAARAPQLADTLTYETGLGLKELDVDWVPEHRQPITRADIDITHGHQDLRERPSKYHAARMCDIYGRPGRTVIYGHTHKPQTYTAPKVGGYASAVGLGCGRILTPGWLHGAQSGWVHQIAVVYITDAGKSHVYPITFHHGQAMWDGKFYGSVEAKKKG